MIGPFQPHASLSNNPPRCRVFSASTQHTHHPRQKWRCIVISLDATPVSSRLLACLLSISPRIVVHREKLYSEWLKATKLRRRYQHLYPFSSLVPHGSVKDLGQLNISSLTKRAHCQRDSWSLNARAAFANSKRVDLSGYRGKHVSALHRSCGLEVICCDIYTGVSCRLIRS